MSRAKAEIYAQEPSTGPVDYIEAHIIGGIPLDPEHVKEIDVDKLDLKSQELLRKAGLGDLVRAA